MFEVDQPGPQAWKRQRLLELGFGVPEWLRLVPVDFEAGESWWNRLVVAGFDPESPAVVVSTGVTMYLTQDANAATLRQMAGLAPASTFATTFLLPPALLDDSAPTRVRGRGEGSARSRDTVHQLLHPAARCWRWRARPASGMSGTCRLPCSTSATSPVGSDGLRTSTGRGAAGRHHLSVAVRRSGPPTAPHA